MSENFDALNLAVPDNRRLMLLQIVRDMQREFCLLHTPGCPMTQYNLFDELCVAIETMNTATIEQIITVRVPEMIEGTRRAAKIGEAILNIFDVMSDVWRGDAAEEVKE